jgi:hypothetical protein
MSRKNVFNANKNLLGNDGAVKNQAPGIYKSLLGRIFFLGG